MAVDVTVFEMEAMNSRGEIIDLEMCIEAISNEGEQFFAAYINDVSEAKQREKELIRARDDYEQANKAKNSFLAMMSHEVRTPLNGVLGLIQLLLEEEDLSARQREYLHIAKSSGKHLLHVLNDILDLTQVESGQLELEETVFSVRSMCQEIVVLAGPEIREKNLFIDLEIDKNLPERIYGDESRLRQVILNFVSNAAKFTDQGHIIIRAQVINNDQPDMVELLFEVEDTGVGLSSQEQSIIFDAFRQLKTGYSRKHEGSGLGLTISKRLIETMDGSIGVDSTPGKGSRFWCVLPITTVTIEPVLVEKNNEYANQKKMLDGRVLLVEDSASNAMVASLILTNAGLTDDVARDGFEAIQSVQSLPYDLVLMDISMPGMDGLDTTRRILDLISEGDGSFPNKDDLPIIAMTAHAMRGDKDRFLSAGMVDYISKPISKEVILSVISEWLIRTKT